VNKLLRAMYRLFKETPARRALFVSTTGKSVSPSKFCEIRWTQNVTVGNRALEVYDDVIKFVETAKLPNELTSVDIIKEAASDPLMKAKVACFVSIAQQLEGFLTTFQSNESLAPFLYDDLLEMLKGLLRRFVKPELNDTASASQLLHIDVDDTKNLLPRKKVVLGESAQSLMSKAKATELQIMSLQTGCQKFLIATVKKLKERSPLKYETTKGVSSLNPFTILHNRSVSEACMNDLLLELHQLNQIDAAVADAAKSQFSKLSTSAVWTTKFTLKSSPDKHLCQHFIQNCCRTLVPTLTYGL
jgi:hypothetical protein